jgi:anthranilate synthase component 1
VEVTELLGVERYSQVMHLVSQVEGRIRHDETALDLLETSFPAGTVSGAPKIRAMEIIEDLEPSPRGPYAGAVGYVGFDGDMDTCIAIRTMSRRGNRVTVQAGAGIVYDSVPEMEYMETENKARALFKALERAAEKRSKR